MQTIIREIFLKCKYNATLLHQVFSVFPSIRIKPRVLKMKYKAWPSWTLQQLLFFLQLIWSCWLFLKECQSLNGKLIWCLEQRSEKGWWCWSPFYRWEIKAYCIDRFGQYQNNRERSWISLSCSISTFRQSSNSIDIISMSHTVKNNSRNLSSWFFDHL